jgi:hypothetical protein
VIVKSALAAAGAAVVLTMASGCQTADHTSTLRADSAGRAAPTAVPSSAAATTPRPTATARRAVASPSPRPVAPKPTPKPTPKPAPATTKPVARSTCGAPANPWGYNFCGRGPYISSPAADVCAYFACIDNFDNGVGYMVQCNDGMYSMSGGRRGACSYHGGEGRTVYAGP